MSAQLAQRRMTVEEFLAWADAREDDGKYELDDGFVVAMAPERIVHARFKGQIFAALREAVAKGGLPCEVFVEGPGIRIDRHTSYQPDVLIQCGPPAAGDERFIDQPTVVVEILSPSTAYRDLGRKARNYFRVGSVAHYLVVDPDDRIVSHRRRGDHGAIVTDDLSDGVLVLDPPGVRVLVADLLGPEQRAPEEPAP